MAIPLGMKVRLRHPFNTSFPGVYVTVAEPIDADPATSEVTQDMRDARPDTLNWLESLPGAFDDCHLEFA